MRKLIQFGILLSVIFVFTSCVSNRPIGKDIPNPKFAYPLLPITILHTNDIHGAGWAKKGRDGVERGGYAAQSKLVDDIWRDVDSRGGVTFILSAGDVNTGVPESDLQDGEPDLVAMSRIGYDAMVLGNHEFDKGLAKIQKQRKWATFPFLSANVLNLDGSYFTSPYMIIDRGVKLGVLGLTTGELKTLVSPDNVKDVKVIDPVQSAKKHIKKMKAEGAELIVGLTHIGIIDPKAKSLLKDFVDDKKLAQAVPELQIIVGGHTDVLLPKGVRVGKTLIGQAGGHGHYIGRIDLLWDQQQKLLLSAEASVIPVLPKNGEDKVIKKLMTRYKENATDLLDKKVADTKVALNGERKLVRSKETNLGNLLTDALREASGADIAIYNGGGIRSSIDKGTITVRDVYRVLPFSNTMVTATITGKQLKQAIESGLKHRHLTGSFLQVSGVRFTTSGDRLVSLEVGGKKAKDSAKYKLATNNFILAGGDHFKMLTRLQNKRDSGIPVERVFMDFLKKRQTVNPKTEGRISLSAAKHLSLAY